MNSVGITAREPRSKVRGYTRRQRHADRAAAERERRAEDKTQRRADKDMERSERFYDAALRGVGDR